MSNINYISGFFDADGSIMLSYRSKKDKYRTPIIDFTNTEKSILEEIQKFLQTLNIKSYISKTVKSNPNHKDGYKLTITSGYAIKLCALLYSIHPKKVHRINTIMKYHNLITNRNGKYKEREHNRKLAYERLFHFSNFH